VIPLKAAYTSVSSKQFTDEKASEFYPRVWARYKILAMGKDAGMSLHPLMLKIQRTPLLYSRVKVPLISYPTCEGISLKFNS